MSSAKNAAEGNRGRLVLVVGPSGAGKDTLLDYVRERLAGDERFRFVRRTITRPMSVGEDHQPSTPEAFARQVAAGEFALHWQANGLSYGLPSSLRKWIADGRIVIANGSRAVLPEAETSFSGLQTIVVTAAPAVLAARLAARGRETEAAILERMKRSASMPEITGNVWIVDNSGSVDEAGEAMLHALSRD